MGTSPKTAKPAADDTAAEGTPEIDLRTPPVHPRLVHAQELAGQVLPEHVRDDAPPENPGG